MVIEWKDFYKQLKEILKPDIYNRIVVKLENDEILIDYTTRRNELRKYSYKKEQFVKDTQNFYIDDSKLNISNKKYYEIPISIKSKYIFIKFQDPQKVIKLENSRQEIEYEIGRPSLMFFIQMIIRNIKPNPGVFFDVDRFLVEKSSAEEQNILEFFKILYSDWITLKISTKNNYNNDEFSKISNSFIFDINYNKDAGIDIKNNFNKIYKKKFLNENIEDNEIAFDKIYIEDLVKKYNIARIADDPFIEYLCYYQILEYFYESSYRKHCVEHICNNLTPQDFSVNDNKDILELINKIENIKNKEKLKKYNNEFEKLKLVLKYFIDIKDLINKLNTIDSDLLDNYKKSVSFSKGQSIDFSNKPEKIYKDIADRIYKTRNSLVHYNESDEKIYNSFENVEELSKEIPLIRILAEEVILKNSKENKKQ